MCLVSSRLTQLGLEKLLLQILGVMKRRNEFWAGNLWTFWRIIKYNNVFRILMKKVNTYYAQIIMALCVCLLPMSNVYSKEYRITQSEISFDIQLERIIDKIKNLPDNEPATIRIGAGYYSIGKTIEIININHNIIICGTKNKPAVISGSMEITGWEMIKGGLWRTQIKDNNHLPDQLYVNGKRAPRSRIPNEGVFYLKEGKKVDSLYAAVLNKESLNLITPVTENDMPLLSIFRLWTVSKRYLMRVSESTNALYFKGKDFPDYNKLDTGNGLIIENIKQGVDTPGEWCVDKNGYIYYMPKDGETIGNTEFRVPILEKLFLIKSDRGENSVCLKNVVFEHTTYQLPPEGCEYGQAASRMSAAIEIDDIKHFSYENCEIRNIANYGIWLRQGCSESIIRKNYFHDLGAGAIKIGSIDKTIANDLTTGIVVENNIIKDYGVLMENAVGIILFNASNCQISHNDVHYGNYSGISLGWVWGFGDSPSKNNEVAYNRISHIGTGKLNDLGGIYTLGKSEGTHIHHNVISDVVSGDFRGWGIYADEGTSGVLVEKNVAYNCTSGGYHLHYGADNLVTNNIFALGEKSQLTYTSTKGDSPLTFTHNVVIADSGALFSGDAINSNMFVVGSNCYWCASDNYPKVGNDDVLAWIKQRDTTSIFQNPNCRDPQKGDFRFKKKITCKVIGFEPFDYTKAGVYGNRKWREKATKKSSY